ncbi:hypothetical protein JCM11491_004789 [Sporobolomyces phaffii]
MPDPSHYGGLTASEIGDDPGYLRPPSSRARSRATSSASGGPGSSQHERPSFDSRIKCDDGLIPVEDDSTAHLARSGVTQSLWVTGSEQLVQFQRQQSGISTTDTAWPVLADAPHQEIVVSRSSTLQLPWTGHQVLDIFRDLARSSRCEHADKERVRVVLIQLYLFDVLEESGVLEADWDDERWHRLRTHKASRPNYLEAVHYLDSVLEDEARRLARNVDRWVCAKLQRNAGRRTPDALGITEGEVAGRIMRVWSKTHNAIHRARNFRKRKERHDGSYLTFEPMSRLFDGPLRIAPTADFVAPPQSPPPVFHGLDVRGNAATFRVRPRDTETDGKGKQVWRKFFGRD